MKNNHLKTILTHKKYVYEACKECGIPLQGILHDLSKFSPTEFLESIKYYDGTISPIVVCKKEKGYSMAWFHHRGRNKHHYEYWVDDFDEGTIPKLMPFKYVLEMFCDFIGAGKAYNGDKFTYAREYEWWLTKREKVIMHPVIWHFIEDLLWQATFHEKIPGGYDYCKKIYDNYLNAFNSGILEGRYKSVINPQSN